MSSTGKVFLRPSSFPVQTFFRDNGWEETVQETRYYTEKQVGEMLLNLHQITSAQFFSPCDKGLHAQSEEWIKAAEKMVERGQFWK